MSFVGKGPEKLCRRDTLVREPAEPDAQIMRREVVVAAGGAKCVLGGVERRAPGADQLVEVDKFHRHTPIVASRWRLGRAPPATPTRPGCVWRTRLPAS